MPRDRACLSRRFLRVRGATGWYGPVGGLVGVNAGGTISHCYSAGAVRGNAEVGGLVGNNYLGTVAHCDSTGIVSGDFYYVGGLTGSNGGRIVSSYSTGSVGSVTSNENVGGLVGSNNGIIEDCYATGSVSGERGVGGLVGGHYWDGTITNCYSSGGVSGNKNTGGLVGYSIGWWVSACFWDTQTSGQSWSRHGSGKTTAEMQTGSTFLGAGWDLVGETANGTEDIWWIDEGKDYPRLWWENAEP